MSVAVLLLQVAPVVMCIMLPIDLVRMHDFKLVMDQSPQVSDGLHDRLVQPVLVMGWATPLLVWSRVRCMTLPSSLMRSPQSELLQDGQGWFPKVLD